MSAGRPEDGTAQCQAVPGRVILAGGWQEMCYMSTSKLWELWLDLGS